MQTTSPVHSDVALVAIQSCCALHTATCTDSAEFKQAVEHRAVITHIVSTLLLREMVHVVGSNLGQEVDILVGVELGHFVF